MNLIEASENGQLDRVKYLVSHGVNIHDKNYGNISLMYASMYGHLEVVKYLVSCGANINYKDYDEETSLTYASENGHLDVVKYLVSCGANIHNMNSSGYTSLTLASLNEHIEIVKYLLSSGANILDGGDDGMSALLCSISTNVINYLCRQYLMRNIEPIDCEEDIIESFINNNKLWIHHNKSGVLTTHDKIILDKINNKIDIHDDLIKYILNF